MIQVDHLTKQYGPVIAVDSISFSVEKGEIVGFLGLNGAGKTTTMKILTSYLPATSGIAKVAGHDVMTESMEVRRNIGYLPESVPLYQEMRVEEYLIYRAKLKGVDRNIRQSRIEEALSRCRIKEVRRRLTGTLSKGYRQRVGLADALIHNPPILILDEPTSGLDPVQISETLATIKDMGHDRTVLFSSHILSEVEKISDRLIIIHRGRIGLDAKMSELARDDQQILVVEIRGPEAQVKEALNRIDGVRAIDTEADKDGGFTYNVQSATNKNLGETVFQVVAKSGWTLRRLSTVRRRLEDRFFEVTVKADSMVPPPEGTNP